MLDKSIPYQNIIMCADRDHLICMEEPVLPEGFSFRLFCPGDEKQWARLEWAVGEFPTEKRRSIIFLKNTFHTQNCFSIAAGLSGINKKIKRRRLQPLGMSRKRGKKGLLPCIG